MSDENLNGGVPYDIVKYVSKSRADIEFIHWDDAYYEDATEEWIVPVEAIFTAEEGFEPSELGWNHGNMHIEIINDEIDCSVGDWESGMHPDLHTFER